jgi:hypothetical protein
MLKGNNSTELGEIEPTQFGLVDWFPERLELSAQHAALAALFTK